MYSIDVILKSTAASVSVMRKEEGAAHELYGSIMEAMNSDNPKILELTCEKQEDKKVAVRSSEINAVIVTEQSGGGGGKSAGFVAN